MNILREYGLTKGEAVMILELNALQQKTDLLRGCMDGITKAFDRMTEALSRPSDGDGWKQ